MLTSFAAAAFIMPYGALRQIISAVPDIVTFRVLTATTAQGEMISSLSREMMQTEYFSH